MTPRRFDPVRTRFSAGGEPAAAGSLAAGISAGEEATLIAAEVEARRPPCAAWLGPAD
jgi:hypothetical protein